MSVLADTIYPPETFIEVIKLHQQTGGPVIAVHEVPKEEVYKYGIVRLDGDRVVEFVEKPKVEDAPSNIISNGVMILPKEAFDIRRNAQVDHL
jgi:UTP--glucose-1-phosphate uridylyltransferase